jgi:glycosyltransferase involved in cell wall biosynthesis
VVITTARLVKQKGINYLIEAFREPGVRERWGAVILGAGEERRHLEEMVAEAGLGGVVDFLGSVADVRPWLHATDVFCLPSLYEGMSNALLEVMACGLPVLATRVSGTVDVVEDGRDGLLVEAGRPEELAEGLRRLEAAEKRREFGEAGRKRVVEFCGMAGIAGRYVELYREMIGENMEPASASRKGKSLPTNHTNPHE